MFKENFTNNLKRARESAKMTQQEAADKLNISRSNITKYEIGTLEPNKVKKAPEESGVFLMFGRAKREYFPKCLEAAWGNGSQGVRVKIAPPYYLGGFSRPETYARRATPTPRV